MANYGGELSSLDFSNLIGGPLTAVVEAQSQAAQSTVDFIKAMGFDDEGKPQYVTFKYPKETQPYVPAVLNEQGQQVTPAVPAKIEIMEMQVPFLTLIPIPFIRVEEATVDFNAKINAVETKDTSSELGVGASLNFKQKWWRGSVNLKASFSYKKSTTTGNKVDRTYSMAVHVRAVQDEMPGGMEKMLGILESSMLEKKATE